MKDHRKYPVLISLFSLFFMIAPFAFAAEFPDPADFDPVWESADPGTSYDRSLPTAALLGNGSLGVVNGGDAQRKLFVLTRGDLWSCGDLTNGKEENNIGPISFADLEIRPETQEVASKDTLDLPTAVLKTEGRFGKGSVRLESWVAAGEDVFIITGVSDADDVWNLRLIPHNEKKSFPIEAGSAADGCWVQRSTVNLLPEGDPRGWVRTATAALSAVGAELAEITIPEGGKEAQACVKIRANVPFAIVIASDSNRRFTWEEIEKLKNDHVRWWKDWWARSRVALGDKELEAFWYGQVYLLGSCVRQGKFPPGLYGLWVTTDRPNWHNDFHMNYNYVGTWYGCFASNRCEAADSMPDPLLAYLPQAMRNAKENLQKIDRCKGRFYQNTRNYLDQRPDLANGIDDAALFPVALGPWGVSAEGEESLWSQISNGAFQCAVICTHWEYTLDREYLKKVFPLLDKTANFFLAWCEKETFPDGSYRFNVWDSHWEGSGLQKNSAPALGCVKHLFATLVEVAPILREIGIEVPDAKIAAWNDFNDHLAPLPVGVYPINGKPVRMLSGVENADGSANPSGGNAINLESVIPGEAFAFDVTDDFRTLAVNAVEGNIAVSPNNVWSGINQTPKLFATAIRCGYPAQKVIDAFKEHQLRRIGQKNFHLHDGVHGVEKIGAMEFIQSMLIQCDRGFVKVFPNWTGADAKFENLRAKGCFLLSAEMKDGQIVRVSIRSEKGGRLRLVDPFGSQTVPAGWTRGRTRNSGEPTLERAFQPGETAELLWNAEAAVPVPVTYIMVCCHSADKGTKFLANGEWDTKHDYTDYAFTLDMMRKIKEAGINVVGIDFTNPSMFEQFKDTYWLRLKNVERAAEELEMQYFLFLGNPAAHTMKYWNEKAKIIWEEFAQKPQYRKYGFGDDRPMMTIFLPGQTFDFIYKRTPPEDRCWLDKFRIGTTQVNDPIVPVPTDGWGYRNKSAGSTDLARFAAPNSGVSPKEWARVDAEEWRERVRWSLGAKEYAVIGTYDDTCDCIFWGIADVRGSANPTHIHEATKDDPFAYYNIVKEEIARKRQ
ncbi:MAG: hypothetical protein IJD43_09320 [Thermoguttaceae bacterium]|nr:hypothetical protein [Thermoguttaceae bacterium]